MSLSTLPRRNNIRLPAGDMPPLDLIRLRPLMERTSGRPEVRIGLIDGPVATGHPDLINQRLLPLHAPHATTCDKTDSLACLHGTFVAGILCARRGAPAPALCPGCTLLIHPVFAEAASGREQLPSATPLQLAVAIDACVGAGARIINLSLGLATHSGTGDQALKEALDHALRRGTIVVAAAGNQGAIGGSTITSHPWVISVVACDQRGQPTGESNLGSSIGRRGVMAPGDRITSLGPDGESLVLSGTSVAAGFVSGAIALLWSEFPSATAAQIKLAVTRAGVGPMRASVVPPLLDVLAAQRRLRDWSTPL
jgi:subtilisin family serine protease